MPSSYYTHASGKPANQTRGLASEVRYELDSIAASFALLPSPTALASGSINYALDTGLTNAYVVSVSSAVTAYSDGFSFFFKPLNNNSGASTLNVNTLGLKAIVRPDGTAVQLNDIVANQILKLTYNSSYNGFQLDTDISYANQAAASASAAAASAGSAAASAAATAGAIVAERSASRALTNLTGLTVVSGGASITGSSSVTGQLTTTDNVGIGRPTVANYRAIIRGIGTTSATNTLVLENSSGTETVIVDDAGNLLIKKTALTNSVRGAYIRADNGNGATVCATGDGSTSATLFVGNEESVGATRFLVLGNGNVQNYNNSYGAISDIKLKQDITDATPKLAKLLKVRIVNYKFKADPDGIKQIGVIAQELEEISPGLIEETPDYEEVTLTREVEKTVPITIKKEVMTERVLLEVIDGVAVQKVIKEVATVDEPVVDEYPVFDGDGNPVMEVVTPATDAELDDKGNEVKAASPAVLRQKTHTVPRMETVAEKEEYTERRLTGTTTKSVKYSVFVPMLIKAMQEQQAQIEALKAKVGA